MVIKPSKCTMRKNITASASVKDPPSAIVPSPVTIPPPRQWRIQLLRPNSVNLRRRRRSLKRRVFDSVFESSNNNAIKSMNSNGRTEKKIRN
ncbi:hypothetical protein NC651_003099 [Populus alba x Populus x berolinensis]|nr:hypothetical protein NC651_003099 [Populus alba x Populus x berolinensis]